MKLNREIGLLGGIAMVVGSVIGMGAYVLIPIICSKAGGSAWLSVTIALVMSLFSVFPIIQLSSAYPVAGIGCEYGRKFISPIVGIVFSWWSIIGGAAGMALVAYGFVQSFLSFLPDGVSVHLAALVLIGLFYFIYLAGIKFLTALQIIFTVVMFISLLVYTIPVLSVYGGNATFTLPQNSDFFMAIIVSFNICLGFQIIMELGEEIKDPKRNIPLALVTGAVLVLVIYLMMVAAYSGVVGLENLTQKPDLILTAVSLVPAWAIFIIRLGLVTAGLSCFNGAAIAMPREIYAQSRMGALPAKYSEVNKNGNPQHATNLFFVIVGILLLIGDVLDRVGILTHFFGTDVIEFYGYLTIMGIMLLTVAVSLTAWNLPKVMPEHYQKAYIRFSEGWLRFFVVAAVLTSLFMMLLVSMKWLIPLFYLLLTVSTLFIYRSYFNHSSKG